MPQTVEDELQPIFLELGRAVFVCQAFEGTLIMLLSTVSHQNADEETGAFIASVTFLSQKTLGQLLKRLKDEIDIPDELNEYFITGWTARNWIVHDFLHECVDLLLVPKGRMEAVEVLAARKKEVKLADVLANKLLDLQMKRYGLSVDDLKRDADRIWDHMNPDQSSLSH